MRQILLRRRPVGLPVADDFEIVDAPAPPVAEGDVLRRTIYLSLDPYMRGRMSDAPSYAASVEIGAVDGGRHRQRGGRDRRNPAFAAGDIVPAYDGWQRARGLEGGGPRESSIRRRADLDRHRRARHAGGDRVRRPARHRPAESRARRSWCRRRPARSARSSGRSRRSRAAAPSASPARPRQVPLRRRRARLRRLRSTTSDDHVPGDCARLPRRHRRLLRERRRRGVRGGAER